MENKKAIEIIKAGMAWANWNNEHKEAALLAMIAIDKQIAKGVIKRDNFKVCKNCGNKVNTNYCSNCGQKLKY